MEQDARLLYRYTLKRALIFSVPWLQAYMTQCKDTMRAIYPVIGDARRWLRLSSDTVRLDGVGSTIQSAWPVSSPVKVALIPLKAS